MNITLGKLRAMLDKRFGGVLKSGCHREDGEACALECLSAVLGVSWTDNPKDVATWDLRPLNDIAVSDDVRTKYLLPVLAAYAGSAEWTKAKQNRVVKRLAILTVQRIVAKLPNLPAEVATQCRNATTQAKAAKAAKAAMKTEMQAQAWVVAESAESAAKAMKLVASAESMTRMAAAASAAALAAALAAAVEEEVEVVFRSTCKLWLEATSPSMRRRTAPQPAA